MKNPANKPCPRPGEMKVIRTKEGDFWRKDRAKGTPMNAEMNRKKEMLTMLSPAAARFAYELKPFTTRLEMGRFNIRIKSCLHRSVKETGGLDYSYMEPLVFQPQHELWRLMKHVPKLTTDGKDVVWHVDIPKGGAVKALNSLITGYRFTLIMIVGDPIEGQTLDSFSVSSPIYERGKEVAEGCELRLVRPDAGEPWVCMIGITSYEGKEVAINSRHAGMKVVGWAKCE